MPALKTADEFLNAVKASDLVDAKRVHQFLDKLQEGAGIPDAAEGLAEAFYQEKLLSNYQRDQLLQGKVKGFFVDKYKILEPIGVGGMGRVYLAEHTILKRTAAMKILPRSVTHSSAVDRFRREAQIVAALDHPNIVRVYDIGQQGDMHYIVMEYVPGKSIDIYVHKMGPIHWKNACDYIAQSALGLQHAHENGIVHRDIKPGNLLLDPRGTIKILDMGLALFQEDEGSLTKDHNENTLGTADYLAPEQAIDSHSVDTRADIYSLGATLYYMLVGETPCPKGTIAQKLLWHQTKQPKSFKELGLAAPPEVEKIFLRMMAKDKDQRYREPIDLFHDLEAFAEPNLQPFGDPGPNNPWGEMASASTSMLASRRSVSRRSFSTTAGSESDLPSLADRPSSVISAPVLAFPAPSAPSLPPPTPFEQPMLDLPAEISLKDDEDLQARQDTTPELASSPTPTPPAAVSPPKPPAPKPVDPTKSGAMPGVKSTSAAPPTKTPPSTPGASKLPTTMPGANPSGVGKQVKDPSSPGTKAKATVAKEGTVDLAQATSPAGKSPSGLTNKSGVKSKPASDIKSDEPDKSAAGEEGEKKKKKKKKVEEKKSSIPTWLIVVLAVGLTAASTLGFVIFMSKPKAFDQKLQPKDANSVVDASAAKTGAPPAPAKPYSADDHFARMDKDNDKKLTKDEYVGKQAKDEDRIRKEKEFGFKDKNKDGSLTLDEFKASYTPEQNFELWDKDVNKQLSKDEYVLVVSKPEDRKRKEKEFGYKDKNKDGWLSLDELKAGGVETDFLKIDKNLDDVLNKDEYASTGKPEDRAKKEQEFDARDQNKDGFITLSEFKETLPKPTPGKQGGKKKDDAKKNEAKPADKQEAPKADASKTEPAKTDASQVPPKQ